MEPLLSIQLFGHDPSYNPGATLKCDYQIDAVMPDDLLAVEASVVWFTEGKGDEDMGVHFFERRTKIDIEDGDLRPLRSFQTPLPMSPLSYDGDILQIHWCVRVRAFIKGGKEHWLDHPFLLGDLLLREKLQGPATAESEAGGESSETSP